MLVACMRSKLSSQRRSDRRRECRKIGSALACAGRTVEACQKREMAAGWASTGSNLADVGLKVAT